MAISIVDWENELSFAKKDEKVGIKIATLSESQDKGTYITSLPPGSSVTPHYHEEGDEEYHIISGSGVIRLLPVNHMHTEFKMVCKYVTAKNSFVIPANVIHQLINNSATEELILIFSCPLSHLKEDRIIIENKEFRIDENINHLKTRCL